MTTGRRLRPYESKLDIDEAIAEVLPQEKDSMIQSLRQDGHKVGMIGDGINDALPSPGLM